MGHFLHSLGSSVTVHEGIQILVPIWMTPNYHTVTLVTRSFNIKKKALFFLNGIYIRYKHLSTSRNLLEA